MLDTKRIRDEFQESRLKDSRLADMARKYLLALCYELEEARVTEKTLLATVEDLTQALEDCSPQGEVSVPKERP